MNKKIVIVAVLVVGVVFAIRLFPSTPLSTPLSKNGEQITSPFDATYLIDKKPVTLVVGKGEIEMVSGSVLKSNIFIYKQPAYGDIDSDGDQDALLFLAREFSNSDTSYYVTLAINVNGSYRGTDAVILTGNGRIGSKEVYFEGSKAIATYLVVPHNASYATLPNQYKRKSFYVNYDPSNYNLIQAEFGLDAEEDPSHMTLEMAPWEWHSADSNSAEDIIPHKLNAFSLAFRNDGTVLITTDCNSMSGKYEATGKSIVFKDIPTPLIHCKDSQEQMFLSIIKDVQSFYFISNRYLVLEQKSNGGRVYFRL